MKIYLASRYSRHPEMREIRDILHGHEVTSKWIDCHGDHHLEQSFTPEYLSSNPDFCSMFAQTDLTDLVDADVVVSYTGEGGKGGRHVEYGFGLGLGKKCIIVGPRENVFHCLPEVIVFETTEQLIAHLKKT